jgi:hypothetical protein
MVEIRPDSLASNNYERKGAQLLLVNETEFVHRLAEADKS